MKVFNKKICFIYFLTCFLFGCSESVKKKLNITTVGPNEYEVQRTKPLDMPPHYDLPRLED